MNQVALSTKDRLRIELAVRTVDWELDGRVPMARRRQIRQELRSNLLEAATQVGAEKAVRQLGDLKALAGSYLELYRGRLDFRAGAIWAFISYVAIQVLGFALFFAFHAGIAAGGSHGGSYSFELWPGFGPFAGEVSASGNSFQVLLGSPAHLLLVMVAFSIGSSYRRVLARH
ncbi:MAG TPA: hypothetical protein VFH00_03380 [Candidatus Nitrosotalea sp.]|nr:hypothetical protein [Candidatus Nitrosotalea sp.]